MLTLFRISIFMMIPFLFGPFSLMANESLYEAIEGFNEVVDNATEPLDSCHDGKRLPHTLGFNKGDDASEFHQEVDLGLGSQFPQTTYENDQISILTQEQADKLFKAFEEVAYMKFDYLHAGCEIRAHEFALIAKENGIEMGKAMTMYGDEIDRGGLYPEEWERMRKQGKTPPVPEGFVGWRYHVAPYVMVRQGDQVIPYVFDIGVAQEKKTLGQWNKSLTHATQRETRTFVKDRAYLHPDDRNPRQPEQSYIQTELNKQELIREMGIYEFEYWNEKGLLDY